jgi:hypothetical protein
MVSRGPVFQHPRSPPTFASLSRYVYTPFAAIATYPANLGCDIFDIESSPPSSPAEMAGPGRKKTLRGKRAGGGTRPSNGNAPGRVEREASKARRPGDDHTDSDGNSNSNGNSHVGGPRRSREDDTEEPVEVDDSDDARAPPAKRRHTRDTGEGASDAEGENADYWRDKSAKSSYWTSEIGRVGSGYTRDKLEPGVGASHCLHDHAKTRRAMTVKVGLARARQGDNRRRHGPGRMGRDRACQVRAEQGVHGDSLCAQLLWPGLRAQAGA